MQSRRIDLEREISIQVPAFDAFITEYSSNISATGMFIRSEKPMPPDTHLNFEFKIADDWKLIRGKATVVWSRYRKEGPGQPSGMGVLFTELDPQSRRLISWIIEKHVREGGRPFELGELREPSDLDQLEEPGPVADEWDAEAEVRAATRSVPPPRPSARPPRGGAERPKTQAPLEPVRFRLGPLILAGLAVALVLAGLFWLSERGAQSIASPDTGSVAPPASSEPADGKVEPRTPDPSKTADETAARVPADAPAPAPDRPVTPRPSAPPPAASPSEPAVPAVFYEAAKRLVEGWSQAWSDQDVDAYLSFYSRSFKPDAGQSRSAWAASRRERLRAPEFIEVTVSGLEAEVVSESRGRASFEQGYRSDTFQDTVHKVLELVREDGRWKILEEKSSS